MSIKTITTNHRVGAAISYTGSIYETLTGCLDSACLTRQFMLNKGYAVPTAHPDDKLASIQYCERHHQTFYVHLPHCINLAQDPTDYRRANALRCIDQSVEFMRDLPAAGVLHIGKYVKRDRNTAYADLIDVLNSIQLPSGQPSRVPESILLENDAGQGTAMGKTWDELRHIFERLDNRHIGLCLDTQHGFSAGLSSFSTHEDIVQFFDNAHSITNRLRCIHLNDSKVPYIPDKPRDRHACLREGYIWPITSDGSLSEGLQSLLNRCYEDGLDVILETPNVIQDLTLIRNNYM